MASPFPFTSGQVLTAAQLNSIGETTAFTPSWTNLTPGNATESWHYVRVNDLLIVAGRTLLGSTSSVSSLPLMDFPVGSQVSPGATVCGRAIYEDSGGDLYLGFIDIDSSKFRFWVEKADATYVKREFVTSSVPMTWTTSDILWMTATVMIS